VRSALAMLISSVAPAAVDALSVARTTKEFSPLVPSGGVPASDPSEAMESHAGPLIFEYVSVSPASTSVALPASVWSV